MRYNCFLIFLILLINTSCLNSGDTTQGKLTAKINSLFNSPKTEENTLAPDSLEIDSIQRETNRGEEGVSDAGLEWLKQIFECADSSGFCLPDEESVTTKRFWKFVVASNEVNSNPYGWTDTELREAKKKYQDEWKGVYPLYEEETWPFGRGNGGEFALEDVEISALGNQRYQVDVTYHESYSTKNKVHLMPVSDGFLIDYIETDFDAEENVEEEDGEALEFTQKWTWSYKDDGVAENEFGHEGEVTAYYNPETNYWLMTRDTYGISAEMSLWILGKPDGSYISEGVSVHPEEPNSFHLMQANPALKEEMPPYYQKVGETKSFPVSENGNEIAGEKYDFTGTSMAQGIYRYMTKMEGMDFSPLYLLGSSFSGEPRLPYGFPEDIPSDYLILEEEVNYAKIPGKAVLQLKSVSDTLLKITHPKQDQLIKF